MGIEVVLMIIQIILLLFTACLIPILNMWFDSKIMKVKEALEDKFFSKESGKSLADKIDDLSESIKDLNKFLLNHYGNCQ